MRRRRAIAWLAAALALALAPAADAQPEPEGWSYQLWNELMSPYCPGRTLADCPSSQAETLRTWILVQEAAGRSRDEVEAELLERYGDDIRSAPRAEGFGLAAYLVPIVAFLAGGALVAVFLRRQTRRRAQGALAAPPPASESDPDLARIVDEELRG